MILEVILRSGIRLGILGYSGKLVTDNLFGWDLNQLFVCSSDRIMSRKIFGRQSLGNPRVTPIRSEDKPITKTFNEKEP